MSKIDEISEAFYRYSLKHYEKELKNSSQPSEKSFPNKSTFQENFHMRINAIYNDLKTNYPPDQAKYIYETFIANLMRQSQNPERSRIINSSEGTINVENLKNYSRKVEDTLKVRHPEKFEVTNEQQLNSQKDNSSTVDFNNPEEKKEYFDNLYNGLSECKTKEEKINYIQDKFGISLENMSSNQQDEIISKVEVRGMIREIKDSLNVDDIKNKNPNLNEEQLKQLVEDIAVKQFSLEHNKNPEIEKENNDIMIELENTQSDIKRLEQNLLNCTDETEKVEILEKLANFETKRDNCINKLGLTKEESEKISKNSKQQDDNLLKDAKISEINKDIEFSDLFNENESKEDLPTEEDELTDLFNIENDALEEDLSDLFDPDVNSLEEKSDVNEPINDEQPITNNQQVFVNSILTGADKSDLKQEDYTIEVEDNKNLNKRFNF